MNTNLNTKSMTLVTFLLVAFLPPVILGAVLVGIFTYVGYGIPVAFLAMAVGVTTFFTLAMAVVEWIEIGHRIKVEARYSARRMYTAKVEARTDALL